MFKLVLEKAEEPEIKLPTSTGSWNKQESSRKTSTSALLTTPKSLIVWITTNWKILQEMGIPGRLRRAARLCDGLFRRHGADPVSRLVCLWHPVRLRKAGFKKGSGTRD